MFDLVVGVSNEGVYLFYATVGSTEEGSLFSFEGPVALDSPPFVWPRVSVAVVVACQQQRPAQQRLLAETASVDKCRQQCSMRCSLV